jgi:hypothetical protein
MLISSFPEGNFTVSVFDTLNDEVLQKWNFINPGSLSSEYLIFIEQSKPLDLSFRYVIVEEKISDKKITRAILYLQVLKFSAKNFQLKNNILLNALSSAVLSIKPFKILICGNLFAVNFPSLKYDDRFISLKTLFYIIEEINKIEKPDAFLLKDLADSIDENDSEKFQWKKYTQDMTMSFDINTKWKSLVDYLNQLTKKYYKRAEKIIHAGKELSKVNLNTSEILLQENRIYELFNQVAEKQTIRMGLISRNYFQEFSKRFPDKFSFIGYYMENNLIAFSTFIDHGDMLEMHYIGIDYSCNKKYQLYFNLLFDGVSRAIETSKKSLELGRTAREAKANLGAKPVYFNDYLKIRGSLAKYLFEKFGNSFQTEMGVEWNSRNPLKEEKMSKSSD